MSTQSSGGGPPDSVVNNRFAHYEADELGLNDQDSVTTWTDSSNNNLDATGGSPTYETNSLNGLPGVNFDGTDDGLDVAASYTKPFTIFAVVRLASFTEDNSAIVSTDANNFALMGQEDSPNWRFFMGSDIVSSGTAGDRYLTGVSATNGLFREDGTELGTGDPGNRGGDIIGLGYRPHDNGGYWPGTIYEVLIYDKEASSTEINEAETYLADKWGL